MKILYDHQIFSLQKYGGISRYFCELYSHILTIDSTQPEIPLIYSENSNYSELFHKKTFFPDEKVLGRVLNIGKDLAIYKINEFYCKKRIDSGNFDIFHPTYYNPYFLKHLKAKPYVLTVYDMIHELFPDTCKGDSTALQKEKVIKQAAKIIAISENTKLDIVKIYGIDPKKIEVIPLATSLKKVNGKSSLELPQKYILFVGNRGKYKNFAFFLDSISSLLREEQDLFLICAGSSSFSEGEIQLLINLKIRRKVQHYSISHDEILSHLYQNATLFVFPSYYEGFGIPILESFSCGCPVIASKCSSLPEVGGDAVNYFDPFNSESIFKIIEETLHDKSMQDSLRIRGYQQLKKFSWDLTAAKTKKVYKSLL